MKNPKKDKFRCVIVVPVYNEEKIIEKSILIIHEHIKKNMKYPCTILIANNGSTDKTMDVAYRLEKKNSDIKTLDLTYKGRGYALKKAWNQIHADIYIYCDIDLSTDLSSLNDLIDKVRSGNDIVIGSRYHKRSKTKRTILRKTLSKGYNNIIRIFFKTKIHDFQCGFKAINNKIKEKVLPYIKDKEWFFDTELLLCSEHYGYKIKEIPIIWKEKPDSKVRILQTIFSYINNIIRLKSRLSKYN